MTVKPYYQDKWVTIFHGDCREILPVLDKASAIVTDPPYELGFMAKSWDSTGVSFQKETWQVIQNACKPGAMLLSFGGTRTFHRIACAIEDVGFEYRDTIMWVYGSGFPKSLNIGKAVDKLQRNERKIVGKSDRHNSYTQSIIINPQGKGGIPDLTEGNTIWEGYGTALKPAYEPIIVAMNPLDGTFAQNALKHGVAGLNIDECRIEAPKGLTKGGCTKYGGIFGNGSEVTNPNGHPLGRFPANFIHDGSQTVMELFPNTDGGSAARFFYCTKASRSERNKGCEELEENEHQRYGTIRTNRGSGYGESSKLKNNHPTVKPLALMEYLVKLVKMPEYNLVIDPFMGSGTTLLACIRLGIHSIGIEIEEKSCEIAAKRCSQEVMEL